MPTDTRDRNKYFDKTSLPAYFKEYSKALSLALSSVPNQELDNAFVTLNMCTRVFVGGNGGSAAISDHLTCDMTKGIKTKTSDHFQVISLCGSHALHTAIANDMGYDKTLSYQLELHGLRGLDTVILISSSGNSPNILEAAKYAKVCGAQVIALTGFDGGHLKELSDVRLHVNSQNYGIVEDCHQTLMHVLAQYIYLND